MYKEQENNHLEWPDHYPPSHIPCMTLTVLTNPLPRYPSLESIPSCVLQPNTANATRQHKLEYQESKKEDKLQSPVACQVTFHGVTEDRISLWFQQSNSVSQWGHHCCQSMDRFPLLRPGIKFKISFQGRSWPVNRISAVSAFWDYTISATKSQPADPYGSAALSPKAGEVVWQPATS